MRALDDVHDLGRVVGEVDQVQVLDRDLAARQHLVLDPVEQAAPEGGADQHDREPGDLLGLDEGDRLEQLVEGAEAARQHDEGLGVLHEHRLADEEVTELDADVDVVVQALLEGQLDAEPDRDATAETAASVGGLHDARPAARDDRVPGPGQRRADPLREFVLLAVRLGARGTEDAHGVRQVGQQPETLDELRLDAQHSPGVGVHPVRGPRASRSRWSVVVAGMALPRSVTGPCRLLRGTWSDRMSITVASRATRLTR